MSSLPQRKRTPEELQELREQLLIPSPHPVRPAPVPPATTPEPPPPAEPAQSIPTAIPAKHFHRSMRRADWEPDPRKAPAAAPASSKLPVRRHTKEELEEMQRRQALANFSTEAPPPLFPQPASPFLITPGYLFAVASLCWIHWKQTPIELVGGFAALAFLVATTILIFRPISRHHSGFISIITLLAMAFASLHYFPQLRYAP